MNRLFFIFWLSLMALLPIAHANSDYRYLCIVDGKPTYSQHPIKRAQCQHSHINGIGDAPSFDFAAPTQVSAHVALPPESTTPQLAYTAPPDNWQKHQYYQYHTQNPTPMNRSIAAASAIMALSLSTLTPEVQAQTTYICVIHGKPAYTTVKQGGQCSVSTLNGLAESDAPVFAPQTDVSEHVALAQESASEPAVVAWDNNDPISQIWHEYEYGSYDKTPILPPPPPKAAVVKIAPKNQTPTQQRPKFVLAAHIPYQPPAVPTLTRRDILSKEIAREQTALKVAQTQLELARKKGDAHALFKLGNVVRDREQNVLSLTRELQR